MFRFRMFIPLLIATILLSYTSMEFISAHDTGGNPLNPRLVPITKENVSQLVQISSHGFDLEVGQSIGCSASNIAFTASDGDYIDIYKVDANGNNLQLIANDMISSELFPIGIGSELSWAPDGSQIVFWAPDAEKQIVPIYIMNSDGGNLHQIAQDIGILPSWSPDGSHISMIGFEVGIAGNHIYVMDPNGDNLHQVAADYSTATFGSYIWAPDGKHIAFTTEDFKDIVVTSLETSQTRFITRNTSTSDEFFPNRGSIQNLDWSADGTEIVFRVSSHNDSNGEIYLITPDGNGLKRLTDDSSFDHNPKWSPNGLQIAYIVGNNAIHIIDANGDNNRELLRVEYPRFIRDFSWSPDGSQILFVDNHNVFVVDIISETIHQLTTLGTVRYAYWQPCGMPFTGESIPSISIEPVLTNGGQAIVSVNSGNGLARYDDASLNGSIIDSLPYETIVNVVAGPQSAEGQTWWEVQTPDGVSGWVLDGMNGVHTLTPYETHDYEIENTSAPLSCNHDSQTDMLAAQASNVPFLSLGGRYVVFTSDEKGLVRGDANPYVDVFVYDRQTCVTRRVSVASTGEPGNENSISVDPPVISSNGRL